MVPVRIDWDESTNKDTLKTLVRKTFDNTDRKALVEYPQVFKEIKTEDYYEREMRIAGLGQMQSLIDGQPIPMEDPKYGTTKDYTQVRYGLAFRITAGMKKFNKIGLMKKLTNSLSLNMKEGKDVEVAKFWNNLTSTTYAHGFDGFAPAYASHTCLDDAITIFSNYGAAALSNASLEAALAYFDAVYDDQGQIFIHPPRKLIVNKSLRVTAGQLLRSDNKSGEQSNTINVFPDWDLKTFVYHRITSSTMWAVIGDTGDANYGPRVYTSQEPDSKVEDAKDTSRDTYVSSEQWFEYGSPDSRLIYTGNI